MESRRPPAREFVTQLLTHVSPDVFEDRPRVEAFNERRFKGDGHDLGLMLALTADPAYRTPAYDIHIHPGQEAGRRGARWVIAKVFDNHPKHIDPDDPRTSPNTPHKPPEHHDT
ncbi:hypothetical protein [Actinomadura decatromicini]|uniref:Uncharacterized protein n=1 Tax=Actinomadura decatromicini TaxID=2604572 RepID=A0A5D3FFY2_9ACTN|nr:hypothetical protein [Actinomadura decatromicini]TYK46756.1 hypothetical protein FXF68_23195 [Actinomadura decatromicini]